MVEPGFGPGIDAQAFKRVGEAFSVLSDTEKRSDCHMLCLTLCSSFATEYSVMRLCAGKDMINMEWML